MKRRDAVQRFAAIAAGGLAATVPFKKSDARDGEIGPDGYPNYLAADEEGADRVEAVYLDGVEQKEVISFDRTRGYILQLDLEPWDPVARRRYGRVTVEWKR